MSLEFLASCLKARHSCRRAASACAAKSRCSACACAILASSSASRSSSARAAAPAGEPPSSLRPLCGQHCRRARHPTERKMPAHWSVKPRCGPRRRCTVLACGTSEPSGGSSSALRFDMAPEQRRGRESRRRAGQPGGARQGALLPSRLTAGVAEEEEGSRGRWLQKGGHRRQSDSLGASSR